MGTTAGTNVLWFPSVTDGVPDSTVLGTMMQDVTDTFDAKEAITTLRANYGVGNTTAMNANIANFIDGSLWYNTSTASEFRRVSGAWVEQVRTPVFAVSAGTVNVTITASTSGTASVTFPASRFSVAPHISLTPENPGFAASFSSLTSSGMTVALRHLDATSTSVTRAVHWQAIQMLPGAASG